MSLKRKEEKASAVEFPIHPNLCQPTSETPSLFFSPNDNGDNPISQKADDPKSASAACLPAYLLCRVQGSAAAFISYRARNATRAPGEGERTFFFFQTTHSPPCFDIASHHIPIYREGGIEKNASRSVCGGTVSFFFFFSSLLCFALPFLK